MASNRMQVVKLAQTFVGCKQGDAKHHKLVDTFNSVKPHGEVGNYSCAWCAITWTALQIMAGNGQEIAPYSYNCGTLITYAKKLGVWIENDAYVPSPGDGIIYYWSDSGKGDCGYGASHVGVVETVSGGKITVIEGNKGTSAACGRRTIDVNGRYIRGFITPKYADGQSTYDYTLEVDGDWGFLTTITTQHIVGVTEDGDLGKNTWKAIQKTIGLAGKEVDGVPGPITFARMQAFLNNLGITDKKGKALEVDGELGTCTVSAWQKWCNSQLRKTTDSKTETTKAAETEFSAAKIKGMDISTWQGDLSVADFKKAIEYGIKFAILRVGFTGKDSKACTLDNKFDNNYKNAIAADLPVGIYYYSLATTEAKAKEEAEWVVNKLKGLKITWPVYIDMEDNNYQAKCSKATLAKVCNAFCKVISDAGYTAGVYANLNWWNNKIGDVDSKYEKWVAQYYTECQYKGTYSMWQYSSSESVPGIANKVDVNICYKDFTNNLIGEKTEAEVKPAATTYTGTLPSIRVKKTSAQVITDSLKWGKMIASNNRFHYGEGGRSATREKNPTMYNITHRCGCYMCNTNYRKKVVPANKAGYKGEHWQKTYVCNPFVNACYAHGGQVKQLLDLCKKGKSLGMNSKGQSPTLHNSSEWKNLGKISTGSMQPGDVLISTGHAQIFYAKGTKSKAKILEATSYEGNMGSKASNSSIRIIEKSPSYDNVYRFIGTIDRDIPVEFGEYSDRVKQIQDFLQWAGFLEDDGTPNDGVWMDNTEACVNAFCQAVGLVEKGNKDRIQWGKKCNEKAKAYKK